MGTILRILLIVGAVLLVAHVLTNIKKSRIQIEDSLFWVSFVGLIIIHRRVPHHYDVGCRAVWLCVYQRLCIPRGGWHSSS